MLKTRKILIVAVLAAILSAFLAISAFAETGTLYTDGANGDVTYTLDGTTLTITFPDGTLALPKLSSKTALTDMLNNAKTVVIKGKGLIQTTGDSLFYGFRNMETLVWPSTITNLAGRQTFNNCHNLKTIAAYDAEADIANIVANPTVGLIDLSNITSMAYGEHFVRAFQWGFSAANSTVTSSPAKLTIKFGNLATGSKATYATKAAYVFANFSLAAEYDNTPIEISVLEGSAFATDAQTYKTSLGNAGSFGDTISARLVTVVPYEKEPELITGTLYTDGENGDVIYSYFDTDPTTVTIAFPEGTESLPKFSGKTTLTDMLNSAKTIIIKGSGLTKTSEDSIFYGFRNMETLVWPSTIIRLGGGQTFNNCHSLKTIAVYTSEDEIDDIVANPTVGLIDLSYITSIGKSSQFAKSFQWSYEAANSTPTTAPAKLTIKFGELGLSQNTAYFTYMAESVLGSFMGDATVPVEISVLHGTDFETDAQEYVAKLQKDGTALGNVPANKISVDVRFSFDDSISATQIGVRYNGDKNGLRYEFKFDKTAKEYMEDNGYELVEYGVIFSSADNKADATLSKSGEEYVTSSDDIKKTAIVKGNSWAEGAKVVSDSATETIFAGTLVNWTEDIYETEAYICAYSIYRDTTTGEETISYVSYGDKAGQSDEYATCSLSKLMNFMITNNAFANVTVSEAAVWNTLLLGAETLEGESKELTVGELTVAILVDGTVVVRSLDGTAVTDTAAATAAVEALGKTVTNTISLTVEARATTGE